MSTESKIDQNTRESYIPQIDWSKAPDWANYWALDSDGRACWYMSRPELSTYRGEWVSRNSIAAAPPFDLPVHRWTWSLTGRTDGSKPDQETSASDGSTASYYELPKDATELQHLISHRDMNAQIGEIFRACYRYGMVAHSPKLRDAKKIRFYINAEIERLEKLEGSQ